MANQSLLGRLASKALPIASRRVFPAEWLEVGDDQEKLREIAKKRRSNDGPRPDGLLARSWGRATTEVNGHHLHLLTPRTGSTGKVLFYCHGGAYVVGPSTVEWTFAARVAKSIGCDLALYDYPKVPEFTSSETLPATMAAYNMIEQRYGVANTVVGGTSAGGGLAVSTLLQLRRAGRSVPMACVLFSPWLDLTSSHEELFNYVDSDLLLPVAQLRRDGELYAGLTATTSPMVSPRFAPPAELAELPPTVVTAGAQEIFLPECQEFVAKLQGAGVDAHLVIEEHGQHVGVMLSTPESKVALAESLLLLNAQLARSN